MANIKSAIKRNKQNEKKRIANRVYRGSARTFITAAHKAISTGTAEESNSRRYDRHQHSRYGCCKGCCPQEQRRAS